MSSVQPYRIAIIGSGPGGLSAACRAAGKSDSHILLEAQPHLSNTIFRYQKGKHVMAEPNVLPLRAATGFEAGTREKILQMSGTRTPRSTTSTSATARKSSRSRNSTPISA